MKRVEKVVESDKYKLIIHGDNILEILIKEGVILDVELLLEIKKIARNHNPYNKSCVFIEGVGFFNVTKEVRQLSATEKFSSGTVAVAAFTKHPTLLLIGELYNKINKPAVETKIFTDKEKAWRWIKSFVETDSNIKI